jgi:hypothetical protein
VEPSVARHLWSALEPYHAVVYFAPEVIDAMKALGLKGFWMGYFAGRAAPMGPVPAPVVTATFFNFHPTMVARAIPDAWSYASPAQATAARRAGVDAALRRLLGDAVASDEVVEAAALARRAVADAGVEGRPLFGGYTTLDWPDEPHMDLWHGTTLLREHRGDGHVVALTHAGLDGVEAHITLAATGRIGRQILQSTRQWSDDEWDAGVARLRARGWLDESGALTAAGAAARRAIEEETDRLALGPCEALGGEGCERLRSLLAPLSGRIVEGGGVPMPNPMGAPRPVN